MNSCKWEKHSDNENFLLENSLHTQKRWSRTYFNFILIYTCSIHSEYINLKEKQRELRNIKFEFPSKFFSVIVVVWGNTRVGSTHRPPFFLSNGKNWRLSRRCILGKFYGLNDGLQTFTCSFLFFVTGFCTTILPCYSWNFSCVWVKLCVVNEKPLRKARKISLVSGQIIRACGDTHELVALILLENPPFCANNSQLTRKPTTRPNLG